MENIDEQEHENQGLPNEPQKMDIKKLKKIQNNRYLNQTIYLLFIQERFTECLQHIARCQPDQYKLYIKALIYKNQFKLDKSLDLLTECQVLNKMNFSYLKGIAKNFYLLGKYKSSMEVAKDAYKLNSSDYEIFYIMAKISEAMKDTDAALGHLNRSLTKQPNQQAYIELSRLMIQKGSYQEAINQLNKALAISPENSDIYQLLGDVHLKIGKKSQAQQYFKASLERNSDNYQSIFSIGAIKQANEEIEESLDYYTKAYKISPNSPALWNNIAGVMFSKRKQIVAYCCLRRALFLDPFRWDIHANLGLLLMKMKKYVGAQIHFRSALKIKKDPYLYSLLGMCLGELGDLSNAEKSFEAGMNLNDQNCKCNYISLLIRKGDKQKAKSLHSQMLKENHSGEIKEKLRQIGDYL